MIAQSNEPDDWEMTRVQLRQCAASLTSEYMRLPFVSDGQVHVGDALGNGPMPDSPTVRVIAVGVDSFVGEDGRSYVADDSWSHDDALGSLRRRAVEEYGEGVSTLIDSAYKLGRETA
jgi:hypothetical protein